jgi:hypothetical protein
MLPAGREGVLLIAAGEGPPALTHPATPIRMATKASTRYQNPVPLVKVVDCNP